MGNNLRSFSLLHLYSYSLLDEYDKDPHFASRPDFEKHPLLTKNDSQTLDRRKRAKIQLYRRCRGLVDVVDCSLFMSDTDTTNKKTADVDTNGQKSFAERLNESHHPYLRKVLVVTHRSVYEILMPGGEIWKEFLSEIQRYGFLPTYALCQILCGVIISLHHSPTPPTKSDEAALAYSLSSTVACLAGEGSALHKEPINTLHNLSRTRHTLDFSIKTPTIRNEPSLKTSRRLRKLPPQQEPSESKVKPHHWYLPASGRTAVLLSHLAAQRCCYQFFEGAALDGDLANLLQIKSDVTDGSLASHVIMGMLTSVGNGISIFPLTLRECTMDLSLFSTGYFDQGAHPTKSVIRAKTIVVALLYDFT